MELQWSFLVFAPQDIADFDQSHCMGSDVDRRLFRYFVAYVCAHSRSS